MPNQYLNRLANTPTEPPDPPNFPTTPPSSAALAYESQHVHEVYEKIASHFSSTRYKPWPLITTFLTTLPSGSIGLDLGCGNGKYLSTNPEIYIIGSDRSTNLASLALAAHPRQDVLVSDILTPPHPAGKFDFVISVAVIHHLSTSERRVDAVKSILSCLRPSCSSEDSNGGGEVGVKGKDGREGGNDKAKALIYVWALEQKSSRRGWDEGSEQDQLVPWVMKGSASSQPPPSSSHQATSTSTALAPTTDPTSNSTAEKANDEQAGRLEGDKVYERYYHLYRKGELEEDVQRAGGIVLKSGWERDNWWVVATPG